MARILLLCISLLLIFSITGCMHDMPPISTDVYVCSASGKEETALDSNGFRYVTGDLLYTVSSNQAPQKSVGEVESKIYTAFGHEFNLEYTDSYYRDFHRQAIDKYIDKDSLAEFDFFEGTDTVAYFDPGDVEIKITESAPVQEQDYKDICEALVPELKDNDNYTVSCQTYSIITDEYGVSTDKKDGFITQENLPRNAKTQYIFKYIRYLDGIPTDDAVVIKLNQDGSLYSITQNVLGIYDNFTDSQIDMEKINSRIEEKINTMCNHDDFQLEDYETSEILVMADARLSVLSVVQPKIKNDSTGEVFTPEPVKLLTDSGVRIQ